MHYPTGLSKGDQRQTDSPARSKFKAYTLANFNQIPHIRNLDEETRFAMEVVGRVLPFRASNYVVEQLIDWQRVPDDPIFKLTFPQREMLLPHHFESMAAALKRHANTTELNQIAHRIRLALNPHPAGQLHDNVPLLDGRQIEGMQHKYRQTVLFFPSQGQTCHAYCTFYFRWPQHVVPSRQDRNPGRPRDSRRKSVRAAHAPGPRSRLGSAPLLRPLRS